MDTFINVMKALSDPNRVRLLKILQKRTLCVCEIQAMLKIAQPSVSKNLKVLEEAGLVRSSKDGLWVNYSAADGSDSPYAANLLGQIRHWFTEDEKIRKLEDMLPDIQRKDICRKG